jgi:diguanylate cyclase (GGDEF)-like protein
MTLVAVMALIHAAVYTTTKNSIEEQLKMGARGVAVSTANTIMGSIDEYKEFLETRDVNSEYYQRMRGYFTDIKENGAIKYIYTERRIDAHTIEFILDAEPMDSPEYSPPGSLNENDEFRESAYATRRTIGFSRLIHYSMWGKLIGAYAPIFDRNGEMLGLIGINIDASNLYNHLNRLQIVMLLIYLLIVGLVLLILMKYSNAILEPVLKDKLTGAYNMRFFENFIQEEIKTASKNRTDLALMMLDLDHFKSVNDTYGHGFGDDVLVSVSKTVMGCLRKQDFFFRYGGEEFVVMIVQTGLKDVLAVAERIRGAVEDNAIFNREKNIPVKTTISIGVSNLDVRNASDAGNLLENADKALYNAKKTRNIVSLFE